MKIKKQKNNGLTLIEALIVLALSAMILFSFLIWQRENALNETSKLLGTQLVTITSAVDQKITIAGFAQTDENLTDDSKNVWRLLTFGSKDLVVANFFGKELIARDSICGSGSGWVPATAKYSKVNLIPCDLWKNNKLPFDMNALGRVVVDKDGFISDVYVVVYFPDAQSFKNNFQYLAKAMQTARSGDSVNKTGRHSYVLVNRQKIVDLVPSEVTGVNACYSLGYTGCALMAKYSRNNSYEYLRTDGTNSMLDTTVSFKKDKASERLKCNRWRKGDDGTWTLDSTVDCGIGIYKPADSTSDEAKAGNEDNVQVVVDYSTQKEIHMDKSCAVFGVDYAGTGTDVIKDLGLREPCGILNKAKEDKNSTDPLAGDVVYQLVDRVTADQGYFKDLYGRKLYIEDSSFIRGDLNVTGDAVVQGSTSVGSDLTVGGLTAVQGDLGVNSDATIAGNTTVLGKLNVDGQSQLAGTTMIKGVLNVSGNAGVTKNLTVAGNAEINGKAYYRDGLKIEGGAEANTFLPNRIVIRGNTCLPTEKGLIAKDTTGRITSCVQPNIAVAYYVWGSAAKIQQYTCPSYKNCGQAIGTGWEFCGFSRVGNLEDSHYCAITNTGTTSAPNWRMDGYKGGCVVYCMNF
jgi:type II secretory pathway pseudopilin PulG